MVDAMAEAVALKYGLLSWLSKSVVAMWNFNQIVWNSSQQCKGRFSATTA
jgi:hypothetical protein